MLDDEAKQCLDALLDERSLLRVFENEALFRAGFQTALGLNR